MQFTETQKETLYKALEMYGEDKQVDMLIEEMSELTKALLKLRRARANGSLTLKELADIDEEMADVYIMLEQILIVNKSADEVKGQINKKLARLEQRLSK